MNYMKNLKKVKKGSVRLISNIIYLIQIQIIILLMKIYMIIVLETIQKKNQNQKMIILKKFQIKKRRKKIIKRLQELGNFNEEEVFKLITAVIKMKN